MSHPDVEALHRVVLVLSNDEHGVRMFIEVPDGSTKVSVAAGVASKRQDVGWFDQAWLAEQSFDQKKEGKDTLPYTLRNIRSGTYLQAGTKLADGTTELEMAARNTSPKFMKSQAWYITNDGGFARIKNVRTGQVIELSQTLDGTTARITLKDNDPTNQGTQTWAYERVSRSAADISSAMRDNAHMPNKGIEYQGTDATYLNLPPLVLEQVWRSTGLGSGSLVWRNQIFDCDDFAFAAKSAVSRWAAENLKCDGFTILFGITFGERTLNNKVERHAYNWYLNWRNLKDVVFFEPSTGEDSTHGWSYKGFAGIF